MQGLGDGLMYPNVFVYIAEISSKELRGQHLLLSGALLHLLSGPAGPVEDPGLAPHLSHPADPARTQPGPGDSPLVGSEEQTGGGAEDPGEAEEPQPDRGGGGGAQAVPRGQEGRDLQGENIRQTESSHQQSFPQTFHDR